MEEKIFTMDEVVTYLKIPKSTVYKLSQKGELPCFKIGKQLRFRKSSLDKWMTDRETTPQGKKEDLFIADTDESGSDKAQNILLIDDDKLVLKAVAKFLKTQGYSVELAENGKEALKKVEGRQFDLIIADVRMPGISGIETIREIRELHTSARRPSVPEIVITAYLDSQTEQEAKSLGITDCVYKPFTIKDFMDTVKKRLEFTPSSN